jgi:hypothetical protein
LKSWFERALSVSPDRSFVDAQEAAAAFGAGLDSVEASRIDQTLLDHHETAIIPYVRWPPGEVIQQSGHKHLYRSADSASGRSVIVKYGLAFGGANPSTWISRLLDC